MEPVERLCGLVADKCNNHAVEVEEKHEQVESELDEGFLFVDVELAEDLGSVKKVGVVNDLLDVPGKKRQVEDQGQPVAVDQEQEGEETMNSSFGDNVGVEAVAEVNGVDVVALQITVHDSEEDLQEQVDGVDQHRQQKQPCFAGHHRDVCFC